MNIYVYMQFFWERSTFFFGRKIAHTNHIVIGHFFDTLGQIDLRFLRVIFWHFFCVFLCQPLVLIAAHCGATLWDMRRKGVWGVPLRPIPRRPDPDPHPPPHPLGASVGTPHPGCPPRMGLTWSGQWCACARSLAGFSLKFPPFNIPPWDPTLANQIISPPPFFDLPPREKKWIFLGDGTIFLSKLYTGFN